MYQLEYLDLEKNDKYEDVIKRVVEQCFKEENMEDSKLYISITLTTPDNIHKINKKIDEKIKNHDFEHEDVLGDIIISIKQVEAQAKEYGHSFEREFAYMLVHGFYHLMGYDHIQEEDKAVMRAKEEKVLEKLEIRRDEMNEG